MVNVKSLSNVVNLPERSDEENQEALAAALRELEEVEEKLALLEKNQVERKVELKNVEEA